MIRILRAAENGTVRLQTTEYMNCPVCGGLLVIDGEFATGEELSNGYNPPKGELIKNHYMSCRSCEFNQGS